MCVLCVSQSSLVQFNLQDFLKACVICYCYDELKGGLSIFLCLCCTEYVELPNITVSNDKELKKTNRLSYKLTAGEIH